MDVKALRDQTLKELERLIAERKEIDRKAAALRTVLNGYNAILDAEREKYELTPPPLPPGYDGLRDMGLTDAIRKLFENDPDMLTPKDVRDKLKSFGYKKLSRSNALAAIHGIFTRLEKAGEITPVASDLATTLGVKNAFRWVNPGERSGIAHISDIAPSKRPKFYGR